MLKGLEATEVRFSDISSDNRLDSEFYRKVFINVEKTISQRPHSVLSEEVTFLIGPFGSAFDTKNYLEEGKYRYVRGQDVKPFVLRNDSNRYIPEQDYLRLNKYALTAGDILLSVVGTIGNACLVQKQELPAIFSCKSTVLRTKGIPSTFILTWLNSFYGSILLKRRERGAVQKGLNLEDLSSLLLPRFDKGLYQVVDDLVLDALSKQEQSESLYSSAESYLLECLGMQDFVANPDAYNIKTLKESFLESGRIDAEYFLPKYEDYFKAVSAYAGGVAPLCEVCTIQDGNYTPEAKQAYRYIELANIGKSGDITGCLCEKGEDLPTRARRLVTTGDVIVSSIEGSLGSCALVTEDYDHALCSTGFYVVRSAHINSETLLTLFKSQPIQQLLKKGCSGTILTGIGKQEFEQIPIPLIRPEVQEEIAQHIQRSFALRKEASQLLEEAKLSVEQAIETGGG